MNDRIYFVGDPHGFFDHFMPVIERDQPAAVVLLGDMDLTRPLYEVVAEWDYDPNLFWFIHGNHDSDRHNNWSSLTCARKNGRDLHRRVVEIAGRRVAGLGGVFRQKIWTGREGPNQIHRPEDYMDRQPPRDRRLPLKHFTSIFPRDIAQMLGKDADILVTHEAPSSHRLGNPALDELALALGVDRHFHGHHHWTYEKAAPGGCRVNGVDMAGIVDDQGREVLPGLSTPNKAVPTSLSEAWLMWAAAEAGWIESPTTAAHLLMEDDDEI